MKRTLLAFASAAVLALVMAGSATGTTPAGYHGWFVGTVDYVGCTPTPPVVEASGTWNMMFRSDGKAVLSVLIFKDGAHHVTFGGNAPATTPVAGEDYAFEIMSGAGLLRMSITGTTLTYAFPEGYSLDGLVCDNVIYHGVGVRG